MAAKTPWFDDSTDTPLIAEYARKLDSFLDAVADARIETRELDEQEKRVVALMKEVEPLLSPEAHEKVTRLRPHAGDPHGGPRPLEDQVPRLSSHRTTPTQPPREKMPCPVSPRPRSGLPCGP